MSGRIVRVNAKSTYRWYRGTPESVALSRQSPDATLAPSGLHDVHGGKLVDDWEVNSDDGCTGTSCR